MNYDTLQQLRDDRLAYVTIARRNKFEDGLRVLLAELYPDNAHFIYELLQNAEDARAATVEFDLNRNRLTVTHDGSRAFTLADVEAITGIGRSPKKDDETQIGKFGVGFKAVYAYTNNPEIRSGSYAFVIKDLFVPDPLLNLLPDGKTTFTFPFDRKEKPPAVAVKEVARALDELDETTVLFLSSIKTIRYLLPDGSTGEITRSSDGTRYISITHTAAAVTEESHWLRLTGNHALDPHIPHGQTVAAAFKLDQPLRRRGRAKRTTRARIVPIDSARTCIYFPAAKESSGLRFHIHAPFASTVARDSVRATEANNALFGAIGRLVADALPDMRDDGLMEDGLLASLPNATDPLEGPYTVIRDRISEAFWNEAITPAYTTAAFSQSRFASAKSLVVSPSEFRAGLDAKDLEVLLPLAEIEVEGSPNWVAPREGRAGRLLNGLGIQPFAWDELTAVLERVEEVDEDIPGGNGEWRTAEDAARTDWIRWLDSKEDEQLRAFYELLGLGVLEDDLYSSCLRDLDLVRVHTAGGATYLRGTDAFFPASRQDPGNGNRVKIAVTYFEDDKPSKSKSHLEAFYEAAGVRHWNEKSQIEVRLAAYNSPHQVDEARHLDDMRLFIAHVAEHPADASMFVSRTFLRRGSEQGNWGRPTATCVDKPYLDTGLARLAQKTGRLPLSDLYQRGGLSGVVGFAIAVGCVAQLEIRRANVWDNPQYRPEWYPTGTRNTDQGVKEDWDLPELGSILRTNDPDLLRLLWELLSHAAWDYGDAQFQLNAAAPRHPIRSRLFQRLEGTAWVLGRSGRLQKPQSMTAETLPEGWGPPADFSLARRLGFGQEARTRNAEELAKRRMLEELGAPSDGIDNFLASSREERHDFFADLFAQFGRRQAAARDFPGAVPADPERRAALVALDAQNAPDHETEIRARRVVKGASENREIARQYLSEHYTNHDSGDMYCQACHAVMPFMVNGSWYFVAVQFLPERRKQHYQNHLALCPLCAAKYEYVRDTDDAELLAELRDLEVTAGAGNVSMSISLNGALVELKFASKHVIDLKSALVAAGEMR